MPNSPDDLASRTAGRAAADREYAERAAADREHNDALTRPDRAIQLPRENARPDPIEGREP